MRIQFGTKVTLVGIAACAVIGIGGGAALASVPGVLSPIGVSPKPGIAAEPMPAPTYPVNPSGQSFGSAANANSPENEPDLIAVIATSGRSGYVLKSELDEANGTTAANSFTSPQDAVTWQETAGKYDRAISVYESDGKTVIGEFLIAGHDSQKNTAQYLAETK